MNKKTFLALACVIALGAAGMASGADSAQPQGQTDYEAYMQTVNGIRQQLFAKQAELSALSRSGARDDAKAQQLFTEIGELRGRLYVAESDFRDKTGIDGNGFHRGGGYGMRHFGSGYGPMEPGDGPMPMHHGGEWSGHGSRHGGGHRGGYGW